MKAYLKKNRDDIKSILSFIKSLEEEEWSSLPISINGDFDSLLILINSQYSYLSTSADNLPYYMKDASVFEFLEMVMENAATDDVNRERLYSRVIIDIATEYCMMNQQAYDTLRESAEEYINRDIDDKNSNVCVAIKNSFEQLYWVVFDDGSSLNS